ncbi:MAG: outer membrane beta-barrel protein [Gemmatimonadota bacterium]
MRRWTVGLMLAFAFAIGWTSQAQAQRNPYEFNVHVGALKYDLGLDSDNDSENTDTDVMLGARFGLSYPSGWGFGANFDWVMADQVELPSGFEDEDLNINIYLYSGEISYTFPATSQARFFVNAGAGAQTISVSDVPGFDDIENETNLMIPVGGGLKWMNSATAPRWAIRGDVRDNIVFGDDAEGEDETDQNFEFSGGVSLIF